jgi:hypothetical protein
MLSNSSGDSDLVYRGTGDPPQLGQNGAVLLLPPQPNAQRLDLDQTVECRRFRSQSGTVYLKLKIQPVDVSGIIVRNQLSETANQAFYCSFAVVKGVYEHLLLGIRTTWDEEIHRIPYTGVEIILQDAEISWDVTHWWVTVMTKIALRQVFDPIEKSFNPEV